MQQGKSNGKRIISKKNAAIMQTPRGKEGYGLALLRTEKLIAGQEMRGHTGSAYGLYSAMFFQPKKKFGFVVINNGSRGGENEVANNVNYKVIQVLYRQFIQK
jgi:D-alanyl-D-alanine carboxypeptidase